MLGALAALGLLAAACGGSAAAPNAGNGVAITDPALVPSSTPIQNPVTFTIRQDGSVSSSGGPPATLAPSGTPTPTAAQTYTVKSGDTCGAIAAQFGIATSELIRDNRSIDSSCSNLHAGDKLVIPGKSPTPASGASGGTLGSISTPIGGSSQPTITSGVGTVATGGTPSAGGTVVAGGKSYTVKSGDSCYVIALSYNVKVSDLIALNGLDQNCTLKIGQVVMIPG